MAKQSASIYGKSMAIPKAMYGAVKNAVKGGYLKGNG